MGLAPTGKRRLVTAHPQSRPLPTATRSAGRGSKQSRGQGRRFGAPLVKSARACVGYPNGSPTSRSVDWSARAAGGGGAVGTAARPDIDHAAFATTHRGIAAGPGRWKLWTRRPATVDPQSRSRTRHRAQHGCGRFRAARDRRVYRAPTRLRLFCRDAAHRACGFKVGHPKRSGGARHLAPCKITAFGCTRLAQVAGSFRDGLCRGRQSPDRKLETARTAGPVSAHTAKLGLR